MNKTLCIYHANCADGLGAAWAVHRALGDDVEFVAARYGEPSPVVTEEHDWQTHPEWSDEVQCTKCKAQADENNLPCIGRDVLIVDFSYPLPVLRAMAAEARSVLVLDHHKTAREDLEQIQSVHPDTFDYKKWLDPMPVGPNLAAIFDMECSGAGLAWDYLHPNIVDPSNTHGVKDPRPRIIDLIEDRDLWRFKYGDETRAFHAVLASFDWSDLPMMLSKLDFYDMMFSNPLEYQNTKSTLMGMGEGILRAQRQAVAAAVHTSRRTMRIAGHVVPVANVPPAMASDAGELLSQDETVQLACRKPREMSDVDTYYGAFSATYYDGSDDKRHFSLRSPAGGADVGQIAKQVAAGLYRHAPYDSEGMLQRNYFVGGGHEHAAGFDAPLGWNGE